jgi:TDG/mug DNA glycosylase family protein
MNLFDEFRFSAAKSPAKRPAPSAPPPPSPPPPARRNSSKATAAAAAVNSPSQAQTQAPLPPGGVPEKLGDAPLRLIIVGHNPSSHAWASGHFYSNPSNWMWRLLKDQGIAPPSLIRGAEDDGKMPAACGVGFTDIGTGTPGTDSYAASSCLAALCVEGGCCSFPR